ncbi:MAG TPA: Gfo/Idh/MocA family oxidoreductase, partial [Candidatus Polarisedimenticolaceae bacterium]|nr:Gfo/Idh/MocA family oxidoreductase [Candidatus Polarisedimenticolaceae bacterium]
MTADVIDVGVVGVGHLGRHHARIYAELPGTRLVGVVDRDRERAEAIAERHRCRVFDRPADLIGQVRAASVAVPTEQHLAVAEPLLQGGVDLLIEKPLASTLDGVDRLLELAERGSRVLMVGHTERFNPAVIALLRAVDAPRFFEIHRLAGFS